MTPEPLKEYIINEKQIEDINDPEIPLDDVINGIRSRQYVPVDLKKVLDTYLEWLQVMADIANEGANRQENYVEKVDYAGKCAGFLQAKEKLENLLQQPRVIPDVRYSAVIHHNFPEYKAPVKVVVFHDETCQPDVMHLAINDFVVGALSLEFQQSKRICYKCKNEIIPGKPFTTYQGRPFHISCFAQWETDQIQKLRETDPASFGGG